MSFKSLSLFDITSLFEKDRQMKSVLIFTLDNDLYGVPVEQVEQVLQYTKWNTVPGSPDYVLGVINVKGKIVTLANLKDRLNIATKNKINDQSDIILVNFAGETIGLLVDKALALQHIPVENIKDSLEMISTKIDREFLRGAATIDDNIIVLLNLDMVLSDYEVKEILESRGKLEAQLKKKEKFELSEDEISKLDLTDDDFEKFSDDK